MGLKWEYKKKIKEIYYPNQDIEEVMRFTKMSRLEVLRLLETDMFRNYTDEDWTKRKKCKICNVMKTLDKYHNSWKSKKWTPIYKAECKYCRNIINKNKIILDPTIEKRRREAKKRRYEKNKEREQEKALRRYHSLSKEELEHRNKLKRKLAKEKYREKIEQKAKEKRKEIGNSQKVLTKRNK